MPESVTLKVDATGGITATMYSCAFWGNSPGDDGGPAGRRGVRLRPARRVDRLPGHPQRPARDRPRRLAHHGHARRRGRGRLREDQGQGLRAAAHLLEADPDDIEWVDGGYQVKGSPDVSARPSPRSRSMLHLFKHSFPDDMESGLEDSKVYDHPYTTMPSDDRTDLGVFYPMMGHACHVPVVEVDIETGGVDVPGLRRRPRLRHPGEPAVAGRAHPRRHRAGHRDGAARGVRLRRRRAAAHRAATWTTSCPPRWRCPR